MAAVIRLLEPPARRAKVPRDRHGAEWLPLGIFALVVFLGPLAFGAVDRIVQLGLLALFVVGLFLAPVSVPRLGRRVRTGVLLLGLLLVAKEFAPFSWFGGTPWRSAIAEIGVELPWTHHPEPGRAVDALLAAGVGMIWFLWVRTLASHRSNRVVLASVLFLSGATVAAVSFYTQGADPKAIYGLRFTPGWMGFGPFPNRNHTACFLAMTAVMGCGCLGYAGERKKWLPLLLSGGAFALIVGALLTTESRGGLLALALGLAIFLCLVLAKLRSRRALGAAAAAVLVVGTLVLVFGSQALARFSSSGGEVSTVSRVLIWKDALALWWQAPLLGHGLGAFASVFPLAQSITLDNQVVLHPESSWLQGLVELGAVPLLLALGLAAISLRPFLRELFLRKQSFFLVAGGLAAAATLALHSAIDVPGHRWGTMLVALAALALACPATAVSGFRGNSRKLAILPLAIGLFWAWPFLYDAPEWSPTTTARLLDRANVASVSEPELQRALHWFPLNAGLHQLLGAEQIERRPRSSEWQTHFEADLRLTPGSWSTPLMLAWLSRAVSPGHSLYYWQVGLDRSGWRREELFARALNETSTLPGSAAGWAEYVDHRPELLLVYAQNSGGEEGRGLFNRWWRERARANDLGKGEIEIFYALAARWASAAQLEEWATLHPERESSDYQMWAALLHQRGEDRRAWAVLAKHVPEPEFPSEPPKLPQPQLERLWRLSPENVLNAQALAHSRILAGDAGGAQEVLVNVARRESAPKWFREKAAHLLAQAGDFAEAVTLLLDNHS